MNDSKYVFIIIEIIVIFKILAMKGIALIFIALYSTTESRNSYF